jgi:hypothetical protein
MRMRGRLRDDPPAKSAMPGLWPIIITVSPFACRSTASMTSAPAW